VDEVGSEELNQLLSALGEHLKAAGASVAIVVVGGSTLSSWRR